jgi:transcriptional regulator with XRE-family HTH domain
MQKLLNQIDKKLINQAEYARRLGISRPYLSMILSGQRTGKKARALLNKIIEFHKTVHKAA